MKEFLKKHKDLLLEIFRFLLVGGLATLVDWLVSFIVSSIIPEIPVGTWNVANTISTACGFIVGLFVNYFLSIIFVFKNTKDENAGKSFKDFVKFATIGVLVLLFQFLIVYLVNDLLFVKQMGFVAVLWNNLTWGYIIAKVIATAIGLVLNYTFRKILIFK